MEIRFRLNGKQVQAEVRPDTVLLDLVRELGCYSVKRGCETANCGLCTVWLDGKPVLSGSISGSQSGWTSCNYSGGTSEGGRGIWHVFSR